MSQSVASSANRNLLNRYLYHTYFNSTDFLLNLPDSILCVAFFFFFGGLFSYYYYYSYVMYIISLAQCVHFLFINLIIYLYYL